MQCCLVTHADLDWVKYHLDYRASCEISVKVFHIKYKCIYNCVLQSPMRINPTPVLINY